MQVDSFIVVNGHSKSLFAWEVWEQWKNTIGVEDAGALCMNSHLVLFTLWEFFFLKKKKKKQFLKFKFSADHFGEGLIFFLAKVNV